MENIKCFGQTRTIGFIWSLLAVLLLWHSPASAAEYVWHASMQIPIGSHSSPSALCSAWAQYLNSNPHYPGFSGYSLTAVRHSDKQFFCNGTVKNGNGTPVSYSPGYAIRTGDACPSNHTYEPSTGVCTPPAEDSCLPTTGNKITHRHKLGEILLGTIATSPPPPSVCQASCRYSDPEMDGTAYRFLSGDPSGAWLNFSYFGDGVTCENGETEADPPSDKKPVSDKENKCTNKVCLTVDEHGNCQQYTYSCTATEKYTDPGSMDCDYGSVNGEAVCVPNSPAPKMTEKDVKTDVKETINPDGSKNTETTTTTTTTNCTGVGACSTSTTTNVSNNKTNADGSDGGSSSSCTGSDCKDGDGKSQNDQKKEEEESQSKVTGGDKCDSPPACTGDAVQCAILRQTYTQRCADEKFQEVDGEKLGQEVEAGFEGSEFKPFGEGERGSFDLTNMIDTSSTVSGSCPVLPPITFTFHGKTEIFHFGTVMAEICKYASWASFLMVAFAMRRAAEIVAGGMA